MDFFRRNYMQNSAPPECKFTIIIVDSMRVKKQHFRSAKKAKIDRKVNTIITYFLQTFAPVILLHFKERKVIFLEEK